MAMEEDCLLLHALLLSLPSPGHFNPMLDLASLLISSYHFRITFIHCDGILPLIHQRFGLHPDPTIITFISIPGSRPPKDFDKTQLALTLETLILEMGTHLDCIMQDLTKHDQLPTCIIADTYIRVAQDVANKFNIPKVDFCTTSASYFSLNMHIPLLVSQGYIPLKADDAHLSPTLPIRGLPPLLLTDIPKQFLVQDLADIHFQTLIKPFARLTEASHVLVNTFYELESLVIDTLNTDETGLVVLPIGPLLAPSHVNTDAVTTDKYLQWLDTRPEASVLFIAFGTLFSPSLTRIQALASGLEASEQSFLWVLSTQEMEALPQGFQRRTEDKGYIISWVNQQAVLAHPAVGGFLSHCGWNSTLESIYFGVPMLGWPIESDQTFNFKLIVEEWKFGMGFEEEEDGIVGQKAIERAVRYLMQEGEGRERTRQRAGELKDAARRCNVVEGGSSRKNLDRFVEDMRTYKKKHE